MPARCLVQATGRRTPILSVVRSEVTPGGPETGERQMTQQKGNRRGNVFGIRLTDSERRELEALKSALPGPQSLGAWMVHQCRRGAGSTVSSLERVVPGQVLPELVPRHGTTPNIAERTILDLCAGSGAWSQPYLDAGYNVRRVTLPDTDVRTFRPPTSVHGVLCAPPCTEFSLAKNGHQRDFIAGMACVNACMRIILQCSPQWWSLENPQGMLGRFLGTPTDWFQPWHFGDPWTKRTCLWGSFTLPERGPYVEPIGSHPHFGNPDRWAETPTGFARAFFRANP
jgi:hypothetical protein